MADRYFQSIPEWIWMALFILVPLIYSGQVYEGALYPRLVVFQILLLFIALAGLIQARNKRPFRGSSPIILPLLIYALLAALSVVQSVNRVESVLRLAHYTSFVLLPIFVIWTLSSESLFRIFRVAAWTGLPISLIGLGQNFGLDAEISGWGVYDIPSPAPPSATFFHRNVAAEYVIGVLPLGWICFRLSRTSKSAAVHAALLVLLGAFLIYTRARGAWMGFFVSILLTAGLARLTLPRESRMSTDSLARRKKLMTIVAIGLLALLAALPEDIKHPGSQPFDEKKSDVLAAVTSIFSEHGDRGRLSIWGHTLDMVWDRPFGGVGLGNWQFIYPVYARGDQVNVSAAPSRPHNDFLWIASEVGIPGWLVYMLILTFVARMGWNLLKVSAFPTRTAVLGICSLVLAHLGSSMFNYPRERVSPSLCFWFAIGAIAVLHGDRFGLHLNRLNTNRWTLLSSHTLGCLLLLMAIGVTGRMLAYDIHHKRVFDAERREDWPTVIQEAELAASYGRFRTATFANLGKARYRSGDPDGAETAYRTALQVHPNSLHAYNRLGILYLHTERLSEAEEAFQRALTLSPGFSEAYHNLGNVFRVQGRLDEAILAYQKALGRVPPAPQTYYYLGWIYHMKGELLKAQRGYQQALEADPGYAPARRALTHIGASPKARPTAETEGDSSEDL